MPAASGMRSTASSRPQGTAPKRNGTPTTRNLIEAELTRAGGLTAREIFESDANPGRAVSRDGIERCLKRGRKSGRYAMQNGKWLLAICAEKTGRGLIF